MPTLKLIPVSYRDTGNSLHLNCYADTLVYEKTADNTGKLLGIRLGGYPEQVRAMSDAIYGGGTIHAERESLPPLRLESLTKQYDRQMNMDGVYAEATIFAADDNDTPVRVADEEHEGQTRMEIPARSCYIFTPVGDKDRLFEEIDKRVSVPLIQEFWEYLLEKLTAINALQTLTTVCLGEKFDAWRLTCSTNDTNIIKIVEDGLHSGKLKIPGATEESSKAFDGIETVSGYLKEFGVTMAQRIKEMFVPLFDPAVEPLSKEVMAVDANIAAHTGYHLYDAQLAAAEGLKRKLDQHDPALLIAECGSGKTKIGATALYASHLAAGKSKTFNVVLCPSHVSEKWVREIEETIPNSFGGVIKGISQLNAFYKAYEQGGKTAFAVFSKEKARDGYMHTPAVLWNRRKRAFICPHCQKPIMMMLTNDGVSYLVPADALYFQKQHSRNHKCEHCQTGLWIPLNPLVQSEWVKVGTLGFVHRRFAHLYLNLKGAEAYAEQLDAIIKEPKGFFAAVGAVRRFALSTYIKKKFKGRIDGAIVDELHRAPITACI